MLEHAYLTIPDVIEDGFALLNGGENGREIVVQENDVSRLLANVGSVLSHGNPDVSALDGHTVVHTVAYGLWGEKAKTSRELEACHLDILMKTQDEKNYNSRAKNPKLKDFLKTL